MAYNFDAAWQSFIRIFSTNRMQVRAGIQANQWVVPIFEQVRGLRTNYLGSHRLKPPGNLRPRMRDVSPTVSTVGNRIRLPSIRYSPYARVPGVQEMNTWEYMEPLWGSAQRIILMLRVWFRRAMRNAGTRPPLPDRRVRPRLTYNPALD